MLSENECISVRGELSEDMVKAIIVRFASLLGFDTSVVVTGSAPYRFRTGDRSRVQRRRETPKHVNAPDNQKVSLVRL